MRPNPAFRHLDDSSALALVNGPDGYVSPRWYADPELVPTWNDVGREREGRVRRMVGDGMEAEDSPAIARLMRTLAP